MKDAIHPKFYTDAKISCVCGTIFNLGSTVENQKVEICSQCHPFYTGNEKVLDTAGRVDKFKKRQAAAKNTKKS